MPSYLSPGVYVEEVASGSKPISGVGTSTAAFVGIAERGEIGKARLVTNWSQFVREFGGFIPKGYLAYAVYGFFAGGGTSCYVVRTCYYKNTNPIDIAAKPASLTLIDDTTPPGNSMLVTAASEGTWGNGLSVKIEEASADKNLTQKTRFKLSVLFKSGVMNEAQLMEVYDNLTMDTVLNIINKTSKLVRVEKDSWGSDITGSNKNPKTTNDPLPFTGGADGLSNNGDDTVDLRPSDFIGDPSAQNGLHAFDVVDTINLIAIPDMPGDQTVISQALEYCKNRKDCFLIADCMKGKSPTEVADFRNTIPDSSYGALYYPWVYINDPLTGNKMPAPPSVVVPGIYADTDARRGVHKAPAGIVDGSLSSVVGVERILTRGEHDLLNPAGINAIRSFPEGICIWGARTLSKDSEWTYTNVRRLLMYIEKSVEKGTQWVVFEPNSPILWASVKRNLTAFLTRVWRDGALFGSVPEEAFFVKVDGENNPPEVRDAGQLVIEVGVAPVKPAEFVIIRVSQKTLTQ
ncbi:MAG TPA: phage tail sheath C-terminal domain-containing protein [Bacillota bacterium]|nr:phage tail sheath C-terminal domain-containing protein [Bacillota bacterium]